MDDRADMLTRYLLGQVSPEERAALEGQYIDDDELFEELIAAENDLIDDYVHGRLDSQAKPFEDYFLSGPERRERVEFAKSLMAYRSVATGSSALVSKRRHIARESVFGNPQVEHSSRDSGRLKESHGVAHQRQILRGSQADRPGSGWEAIRRYLGDSTAGVRLALATLLLFALIGLSLLATINWKLHKQTEAALEAKAQAQRQTQELRGQIAELQENLAATAKNSEAPPPAGSVILSSTLAPDLARSASHNQTLLQVFRGVAAVRLFLKVNDRTRSTYSAVLETAEGAEVWRGSSLSQRPEGDATALAAVSPASIITIQLSPDVLKHDDYVLRLFRVASRQKAEEVGTYSFRVTK